MSISSLGDTEIGIVHSEVVPPHSFFNCLPLLFNVGKVLLVPHQENKKDVLNRGTQIIFFTYMTFKFILTGFHIAPHISWKGKCTGSGVAGFYYVARPPTFH